MLQSDLKERTALDVMNLILLGEQIKGGVLGSIKLLPGFLPLLESVITSNKIEPFYSRLDKIIENYVQARTELVQKGLSQLSREEQEKLSKLSTYLLPLQEKLEIMTYKKICISHHLQWETQPCLSSGEIFYLNLGYLILPSKLNTSGYFVLNFKVLPNPKKSSFDLGFKKTSLYGQPTLEEAMILHLPKENLATIVIGKNTEHYLLDETVLPLFTEWYRDRIISQK